MNSGYLFTINYAPCLGILFLFVFLAANAELDAKIKNIFYRLLILEAVELVAYSLELIQAQLPYPTDFRIYLSAVGYSVRPWICVLLIHLSLWDCDRFSRKLQELLRVPALLNLMVAFSAFWTDAAYSYTADNAFVRGPLGYVPIICLSLYLAALLLVTLLRFRGKARLESVILLLLAAFVMIDMVAETKYKIHSIGRSTMVLCTIFYYMFFQTWQFRVRRDQNMQDRQRLELQTRTDRATNLLNKTAFKEQIRQIVEKEREQNIALVFLDLDHFKEVNDKMGHLTGDMLLLEVAEKLHALFRRTDVVGRFGGDEFCVLMQNIPYEMLEKKLSTLISVLQMEKRKGDISVQISASVGCVYLEKGGPINMMELFAESDKAVYEAKANGRNQYVIHKIGGKDGI